jgi:hypothetical protein
MTVAAVELGKYISLSAVCWLAGLCAVGYVSLVACEIWKHPRALNLASRRNQIPAVIAIAWTLFAIFELVDIANGNKLYLSVTIFDHALRTAFVDSVLRTGVPPANPLYFPGHPAPMRYYYFWYVLTAAAARLGGTTARQAMIASVAWAGFGLASVVALYCRHFLPADSRARRRLPRIALALALLTVTGLDILPALVKALLRLSTDADMEWWSPDQVTSWIDSTLWVPHHIAGLVCCLFGFLLVWMSKGVSPSQRAACAVIVGLSFASAFGLSTWVAIAFAMVMLVWTLWSALFEPLSRPRLPVLLAAALVAALALIPYLTELRHASPPAAAVSNLPAPSIAANASHLLRLGVRHIIDPDCLLPVPWFAHLALAHPRFEDAIAGLILLPPGYFVELGFYGLVLVLVLVAAARSQLDEAARTSLVLTLAGLTAASFLRSTVIANNDFGIRSILIAQFYLLLLAVQWCEGAFAPTNRPLRIAMYTMLWIGLTGTAYQVAGLRLYLPVEEHLGRPDEAGLAERAMALRRGFEAMDQRIPRDAVVQFNTAQPSDLFRYAQIMQAGRQMATAFPECDSVFGGDPSACPALSQGVDRLFSQSGQPAPSAIDARTACAQLGVTHLIATEADSIWLDRRGWVWNLPAAVDTGNLRVLNCTLP